jgi:hypothetical protein
LEEQSDQEQVAQDRLLLKETLAESQHNRDQPTVI